MNLKPLYHISCITCIGMPKEYTSFKVDRKCLARNLFCSEGAYMVWPNEGYLPRSRENGKKHLTEEYSCLASKGLGYCAFPTFLSFQVVQVAERFSSFLQRCEGTYGEMG